MDISFIIPARNERDALGETIAHLCRTACAIKFEIIVVDDCSDEVQLQDASQPSEVMLCRCRIRQGVARARNIGASLAKGHVLMFLDAHVCFSDGWLKDILGSGVENGDRIVGTGIQILWDFSQFSAYGRGDSPECLDHTSAYFGWLLNFTPRLGSTPNWTRVSQHAFQVPYVGAASLAISRDLFQVLGGFEHGFTGYGSMEDAELAMRCWSFGYQVYVIPSILCWHYTHPQQRQLKSMTRQFHPLKHPQYDGLLENALRMVHLHCPRDMIKSILSDILNDPTLPLTSDDVDAVVVEALRSRIAWIDQRRKHGRDWLMDRMTRLQVDT